MTNERDSRYVDATPAKRFFVSMLIRDIELIPAIVDLVDNSADGAKRLRPTAGDQRYNDLWVNVVVSQERFEIEDNCGGMDIDLAREYAFRFGRVEDATGPVGEVGQFGIGMKRALFKIGERFTVDSATPTSRFSLTVNVPEWTADEGQDWSFRLTDAEEGTEVPEEEHGTKIVVEELHELVAEEFGQERFIRRLRRELAMRQLRLLQQGLRISVNEEPLSTSEPLLLASDDFSPVHVEKSIPVGDTTLSLKLWAGLVAAGAGEDDDVDDAERYRRDPPAGWYVFCNDRLLLHANKDRLTGWGAEAAAYHPQYSRFRGYVLLDGDARHMPWNTTKTSVDEDSRVFREVQNEMFDALQKVQAVINRLKNERRQTAVTSRPAVEALERATPVALDDLPPSPSFKIPEPAPDPPRTGQWIRYQVDLDDYERVAEAVGSETPADVGRTTFDWYLDYQVD